MIQKIKMKLQRKVIIINQNKTIMNKLLVYIFIITFFSCKGQEKQDNLIDTKVNIDKLFFDDYIYKSSVLDRLFKQTHGLYIEGKKKEQ